MQDIADDFNKNSTGRKLRRVPGIAPVRTFAEVFSVAMGEWELREMLSTAIGELHNNGTLERIMKKYESTPGQIGMIKLSSAESH